MAKKKNKFKDFFTKIFPVKMKNGKKKEFVFMEPIVLSSVDRESNMNDGDRREYATELIDTYKGFGKPYVRGLIQQSISTKTVSNEMVRLAVCLPLLKKFINAISLVYKSNPERAFYLDDKKIVGEEINEGILDKEKYIVDEKLYKQLSGLYHEELEVALKDAEKYTNLFQTTIYKIITDVHKKQQLIHLSNDTIQAIESEIDITKLKGLSFIKDQFESDRNIMEPMTIEMWTPTQKKIPALADGKEAVTDNEAGKEAEELYGVNQIGWGFAPFVVLRSSYPSGNFWNTRDADTIDYIKSINMAFTELRYLIKYTSFGLKYTVNIKVPNDGAIDPMGFLQMGVQNTGVPGTETGRNWDVGEFSNSGRIKEVIHSIIFNLKMLFTMYDLPLDALISSNSVRSAENKEMDDKKLFEFVNAQREIWNLNEKNLFKTLVAVYNRDNSTNKLPRGLELRINFTELTGEQKTSEEWMIEIQNNIKTFIDWLAAVNPDLNQDELKRLYQDNLKQNSVIEEKDEDIGDEEDGEVEDNCNCNNDKEKK
jgi:hypothetical protein